MSKYHERIAKAIDTLTSALTPYVEQRMEEVYGLEWQNAVRDGIRNSRALSSGSGEISWDAQLLLTVMWDQWNQAFRQKLGFTERSLVSELREYRNRWAHQEQFDFADTYRFLDSVERLLAATGSAEAATIRASRIDVMKRECTRQQNDDLRRSHVKRRKIATVIVYMTCCTALTIAFWSMMGWQGVLIAMPLGALFLLFSVMTMREPTIVYGPHECPRCSRIIYSAECPYCNPVARPRLADLPDDEPSMLVSETS